MPYLRRPHCFAFTSSLPFDFLSSILVFVFMRAGNPVTMAYAIVQTKEAAAAAAAAAGASGGLAAEAALYVDAGKLSDAVRAHLAEPLASGSVASVRAYDAIWADVAALQGKVWVDPAYCNYAIFEAVSRRGDASVPSSAAETAAGGAGAPAAGAEDGQVLQAVSPIQLMKALKNGTEADGMRAAHVRDGAALTAFFAWLETALQKGIDARTGAPLPAGFILNEFTVCPILGSFRAAQADFVGLSFPTIAGSGANGAIIHYRPEEATAASITTESVFLCDSGAQYRDGTTGEWLWHCQLMYPCCGRRGSASTQAPAAVAGASRACCSALTTSPVSSLHLHVLATLPVSFACRCDSHAALWCALAPREALLHARAAGAHRPGPRPLPHWRYGSGSRCLCPRAPVAGRPGLPARHRARGRLLLECARGALRHLPAGETVVAASLRHRGCLLRHSGCR